MQIARGKGTAVSLFGRRKSEEGEGWWRSTGRALYYELLSAFAAPLRRVDALLLYCANEWIDSINPVRLI